MNYELLAKYLAGAGLIGSLFALVLMGSPIPQEYLAVVTLALGALGISKGASQ